MVSTKDHAPRPYEVHTNRELEFMLLRGKLLAHFSDSYPSSLDEELNEDIIPERKFAPCVQSGKLTKREFVEPIEEIPRKGYEYVRGTRHVFYAAAAEDWRIDAYIMMMSAATKAGWSEGF